MAATVLPYQPKTSPTGAPESGRPPVTLPSAEGSQLRAKAFAHTIRLAALATDVARLLHLAAEAHAGAGEDIAFADLPIDVAAAFRARAEAAVLSFDPVRHFCAVSETARICPGVDVEHLLAVYEAAILAPR